ncbi:MAG: signal peptidase II [Candidatus Gracilibacteria bacterium]|nr:signal peptidase II [Candidatus Gracilibacteria bacterium]
MLYFLIPILVFIDLFTKYLAENYLVNKINIFGKYLFLKLYYNTGIAFSIPITGILLKIITIFIISIIVYYFLTNEIKNNNKFLNLGFCFIIGGAVGNGYERIFNHKVIDFIGIKYFSIFNFADIFLTIGVLIYIYYLIFKNESK